MRMRVIVSCVCFTSGPRVQYSISRFNLDILSCKVLDIKLPWDSGTYIPNRAWRLSELTNAPLRFRDKKVHDCNGRVGEASRWKKDRVTEYR